MFKSHLAFSEASDRQHHSEVLYLNLFKKTTTCVSHYTGKKNEGGKQKSIKIFTLKGVIPDIEKINTIIIHFEYLLTKK